MYINSEVEQFQKILCYMYIRNRLLDNNTKTATWKGKVLHDTWFFPMLIEKAPEDNIAQ